MRRLVVFTLFLILNSSNAYARETKKEKKYRAGEFRKALIALDRSYLEYQLSGKCTPACFGYLSEIKKQWPLITKKLSKKRLSELEVSIEHYRGALQTSKSVDISYDALKTMFLNYFKFRLEPLQRPSFDDGETLYKKYCESCHGAKADGKGFLAMNPKFPMDPPPSNLSELAQKGLISPLYVSLTSLEGIAGTTKRALKDELNHHELWSLSYYALSTAKRCSKTTGTFLTPLNIKTASFYSDKELDMKGFKLDPRFRCNERSWNKLKR